MRLTAIILAVLNVSCLVAQQVAPTEGVLPQFTRIVSPPARATIPLQVSFPASTTLRSAPVTFGVPFPRGALQSVEHLGLLQDGNWVPAIFRCTATWDGPDGPVKWALVEAPRIVPGEAYALEYGTQVRPSGEIIAIHLTDTPERVVVSTGPFQFSVGRRVAALPEAAWLDQDNDGAFTDAEAVLQPGKSVPYMLDQQGTRYALNPADDYTVTVEDPGPLHAIIKVSGWYTSVSGEHLCQVIARLHAYAGESFLRLEHTFVVAYDTDATQLRDIALPFALTSECRGQSTFGLEEGKSRIVAAPAHLVQDQADRFLLSSGDGAQITTGERAAGWVDMTGARGGMTAAIRHFWQEFPRELEATDDGLVAHLWPLHSDWPLDFQARAVLGDELYQKWDQVYWQNWYKGGLDKYDQAYGLAKSNDLMLVFHGPDASTPAPVCATLDEPVIVAASPEWMCRSDVMGPLHPYDPQRFPDDEEKMAAGMRRFELLRENLGNYGLINYGDANYNMSFDQENQRWQRGPWRCWGSRFYGHPVMAWVQFLRTGQRRYLQWGTDNARHVMDIDMCHLTNEKVGDYPYPKHRGGRFGGNGGIIHYAGNIYDIGCDSHVDHLLLQYYLTGYRRAWDVLQEEADFYLLKESEKYGSLHRWGHRMTGGNLRTMVALYRATWDERYLTVARRQAQYCYESQDAEGIIRHDDVYMAPGLVTYFQTTGDERMRELFLRSVRKTANEGRLESDPRSFSFYGPAMAYFMTGDPSYLRWAERWRRDFSECINMTDDPLYHGQPDGQWDYCYLTLHLMYMPYYLQALSTLDKPVTPATREDVITSGEVLLQRPGTDPFDVSAEVYCYDGAHSIAVAFPGLKKYLALNPTEPRLVVRDAQGREIASQALSLLETTGNTAAPELPGAKAMTTSRVRLTVPAGPAGTYRLGVEGNRGLQIKYRVSGRTLRGIGYATDTGFVAGADAYVFRTPDAPQFEVGFKVLALRRKVTVSLLDAAGRERKREELNFGSNPQSDYVTWIVEVEPEERNKPWRLRILPPTMDVDQVFLKSGSVLPVVWASPEAMFEPDADALKPRSTEAVAVPYPDAGPSRRIEPGKPLVIARDGKLDPQQGTLEFWFRPEWAPDDISDRNILSCGQMRLHRRSSIGTYLVLGGIRQSAFATLPGRWVHLAITWDAGAEGRQPKTQLFINGLEATGSMLSAATQPLGDWAGPVLSIGGDVAFTIDDLRVSDTVRYDEDFAKPAQLERDEHTLVLMAF